MKFSAKARWFPLFQGILAGALCIGGVSSAGEKTPPSDAETKFLREVLDRHGVDTPLRPVQELEWREISEFAAAGVSFAADFRDLKELARERGWKLDDEERGLEYLVSVLDFMSRAARGELPDGLLRSAREAWTGREKALRAGVDGEEIEVLRHGAVAVSLEDTGRFIGSIGEEPGWTLGADVAVYILKESGATLADIEYAGNLLWGSRPQGLSLDIPVGEDRTMNGVLNENTVFREVDSNLSPVSGTERALSVRTTARAPRNWFARQFVKDITGSYHAYALAVPGAERAYLIQLDARTPSRGDRREIGGLVPMAKDSFGSVVKDLGDRWGVFERHYYRGQDVDAFRKKVWEGQVPGLREDKGDFIRLALALSRLRAEGRLPPPAGGFR